jgi:hypothetical protein
MIPFLISSQVSDALVRKLQTEGFRLGSDIMLKKPDDPDMNTMLFNEYVSIVLLPLIARVRSNPELDNELAVLLMDDCSDHMRNDTLKELTAHRVKLVIFPPHATNSGCSENPRPNPSLNIQLT